MINSISTVEQSKKFAFDEVSANKAQDAYWLNLPKTQNQQEEKDDFISKIKIVTPEEARKTHNVGLIGASIATATVLTAGALFFISKGGGSGNLVKYFEKARITLEKKIQSAKLDKKDVKSTSNKINMLLLKLIDSGLAKSEAVNNFTSFKDILFKRLMNLTKGGGKLHDNITKWFKSLGLKTVNNEYKTSAELIHSIKALTNNKYYKVLNQSDYNQIVVINGVPKMRIAWFQDIEKLNETYIKSYKNNFDKNARRQRYFRYKKAAEHLKSEFSTLGIFKTKDVFNKFIAEATMKKEKLAIQKIVKAGRRELSYSIYDLAKESDDIIMKMSESISLKDVKKIGTLGNIRANIKKYAKNPEKYADLKDVIRNDIENLITGIENSEKEGNYSPEILASLKTDAQTLYKNFTSFKQGTLEDILNIYKHILPKNEYSKVEQTYKSGIRALDNAIKVETEDFANKLRDLTLGSAPTDILSLLGGLGILGYNLSKADNNDQRVSISLKYGIPAITLIGVSLYCNAKLFAGTKALITGSIASFLMNQLGSLADDTLKNYKAKKTEVNPPKTV